MNLIHYREVGLRIAMHLLFWLFFFGSLFVFTGSDALNANFVLIDLPVTLFYSYFTAYVLVPILFARKRYLWFMFAFAAVSLILSYIRVSNYDYLYYSIYAPELTEQKETPGFATLLLNAKDFSFGLFIFMAVKFSKNHIWSEDFRRNYEKEKMAAEVRLMKSQIDPHFLFNTLNNLYSLSVVEPAGTSPVIRKFWGIMDFLVYECRKNTISVEKEIKLISDYVELERIRYSDRLVFEMEISGDLSNFMIPPLLLFPLVENCFKYGSSDDPGNPWIRLRIVCGKGVLRFSASNSIYTSPGSIKDNGDQLAERLKKILPGRHKLKIERTGNIYKVHLEVQES